MKIIRTDLNKHKTFFVVFGLLLIPYAIFNLWQAEQLDNCRMREMAKNFEKQSFKVLEEAKKACLKGDLSDKGYSACFMSQLQKRIDEDKKEIEKKRPWVDRLIHNWFY